MSGSQRHKTAVDGAEEQEISRWEFQFGKMRRSGDSGRDGHTRTRSHTPPLEGMVGIVKPGLEAWLRVLLPGYKALYHRK